ncbi:nucleoside phosphorylase [Hydrogenophaga sp.]|uniref:5'-methylthioadenosine/S-adenosylhomocysteine nucleosidase family protein n=1 Tax=Hydrogenophaga sp. TaxID=1904254 RepID=UPI00391C7F08
MTDFAANLAADIGLFIIDTKIPSIDNATASQNGQAIIEAIVKTGRNDALLLAISSYPEDFPNLRSIFEKHGCILADFREKSNWQSTLDHLLIQYKKTVRYDFLIFCALQEERNPYISMFDDGQHTIRTNIDCFDIDIGNRRGSVVLLPKMGLVNAAITASVCIERFMPSIVAMSGICGGIAPKAGLGQLVISEMAYEYQSGKWSSDGFQQEPYQVPTDHNLLNICNLLTNQQSILRKLEDGFPGTRPSEQHLPMPGIFTSGSAVIANSSLQAKISQAHRKVCALDMEVFAIQRAAQLSSCTPPCLCAKTVVDLCNNKKDDSIHHYGSYISAKFVVMAIENFFNSLPR